MLFAAQKRQIGRGSDRLSFGQDQRIALVAHQHAACMQGDFFVGNGVTQDGVRMDMRVLHQNAVFHCGPFFDADAAEQNAVFHRAFNDAAVCYQSVFCVCLRSVIGGGVPAVPGDAQKRAGTQAADPCGWITAGRQRSNQFPAGTGLGSGPEQSGVKTATAIKCFLMRTDKNLSPMEAIVKNAERKSLYDALELAAAWLQRA